MSPAIERSWHSLEDCSIMQRVQRQDRERTVAKPRRSRRPWSRRAGSTVFEEDRSWHLSPLFLPPSPSNPPSSSVWGLCGLTGLPGLVWNYTCIVTLYNQYTKQRVCHQSQIADKQAASSVTADKIPDALFGSGMRRRMQAIENKKIPVVIWF